MSYTESLREKLREFLRSGPTGFTIEKRTGIHRQIIARFSQGTVEGINFENGMTLRRFLKQWEKEFGNAEKRYTGRVSKDRV